MKKSILITGAAGFIGSHLTDFLLAEGYNVIGVDNFDPFYDRKIKKANLKLALQNESFLFIEGDAGSAELLNKITQNVDAVIHLAAKAGVQPSLKAPVSYIKSNIELTNNILEWMIRKGVRKMVFASSSSVYGNNSKVPFEETDDVNEPISPYAFTKRSCELLNYTYHKLYNLDIINLRFFTVYGERQRPDLAICKFLKQIKSGVPISVYGDGKTARDYTYYRDTIKGIYSSLNYLFANEKVLETINLGNHHPIELLDLIATISDASGIKPVLVYEPMKPGDVNVTYADISKAHELLGYSPQFSLVQGLQNFVKWYDDSLQSFGE